MNHREVTKMLERHYHNSKELIIAVEKAGGDPQMMLHEKLLVSELLETFARNGIRMTLTVERPEQ